MQIESYMKTREEFSEAAQRLTKNRRTLKQVLESLNWEPVSFSFTKNGMLLADHGVEKNHTGWPESESWPSVDELTELANLLHAKKAEMDKLYKELPEAMQKVVHSPNDLLKLVREEGRR